MWRTTLSERPGIEKCTSSISTPKLVLLFHLNVWLKRRLGGSRVLGDILENRSLALRQLLLAVFLHRLRIQLRIMSRCAFNPKVSRILRSQGFWGASPVLQSAPKFLVKRAFTISGIRVVLVWAS